MLGVCVFLWGFSYKLSLYDFNPRTLHRIPEAKLLSKNEDRHAADGVSRDLARAEAEQDLQLLQLTLDAPASVSMHYWESQTEEFADSTPQSAIPLFELYFRPPPLPFVL